MWGEGREESGLLKTQGKLAAKSGLESKALCMYPGGDTACIAAFFLSHSLRFLHTLVFEEDK